MHKLRLATMLHGVDFTSHPGGVMSVTHGEGELEDTAAAMRNTVRMLRRRARSETAVAAVEKFRANALTIF